MSCWLLMSGTLEWCEPRSEADMDEAPPPGLRPAEPPPPPPPRMLGREDGGEPPCDRDRLGFLSYTMLAFLPPRSIPGCGA